ncbi:hypothetical protein SDC9_118009 [bioreactor metagenome]|uniref:Uncharacterized protein n=1 Tax=bioreactor metagenome TaxID=1076179 RepID=A0A645BZP8_9ZZZZ
MVALQHGDPVDHQQALAAQRCRHVGQRQHPFESVASGGHVVPTGPEVAQVGGDPGGGVVSVRIGDAPVHRGDDLGHVAPGAAQPLGLVRPGPLPVHLAAAFQGEPGVAAPQVLPLVAAHRDPGAVVAHRRELAVVGEPVGRFGDQHRLGDQSVEQVDHVGGVDGAIAGDDLDRLQIRATAEDRQP